MEAEEEGSKKIMGIEFQKLPANYHNESYTDAKVGNKTIHRHQEIDKVKCFHFMHFYRCIFPI